MRLRKVMVALVGLCLHSSFSYGQDPYTDSVRNLLQNHPKADTFQAACQITLAYRLNFLNPDTALILATQALRTAQKFEAKRLTGSAYHAVGFINLRKNNDARALDAYLKAIPYFEQVKDGRGLSVTYRDIGVIYEKQAQTEQALNYYQKSYWEAVSANFPDEEARQLARIATIYNHHYHKRDTAARLLQLALQRSEHLRDPDIPNSILENMGYLEVDNRNYRAAIELFRRALGNYEKTNGIAGMAKLHKALALAHGQARNYKASLAHAQKGMELAQVTKDNYLIQETALLLSNAYEKQGNIKKALEYQHVSARMKDSIYNTEKTTILTNLQTKFDIHNQQREIDLLNKSKWIQAQEIRRKTYERNASIVGVLLLAALAFLLYQYIRYQRQNNQLLQAKSREIERQKEQLIQLNATKDKLFSIISHDIRSPLNSLEATLELMEDGYLSIEEMQIIAPELRRKVHTTSGLLTNILHWARSQMEGIVTNRETFDLSTITQELATSFQLPAQDKQIVLECQVPVATQVHADPNMISLILRNLISNAIKFTPAGGKVTIQAQLRENQVVISVKDTGKGMNEEQRNRLFDRKTHFSTSGTDNEVGTGLGLLLCKEFTEKNDGRIWVESQPNEGSSFFLSLPTV